MSAQHTPGPWFSQYDDNGFYKIGTEAPDASSLPIAFTYGEGETDEANARLIAAAVDLLAALELAVHTLNPGSALEKMCRAAIEKAEGGAA